MISETASAALYLVEVFYTAALWAYCAEGIFPPRGHRRTAFWLVACSGMTPAVFVLWFPAGTEEFYLTGTLTWLLGMLMETITYCLVYEGPWTGKIGWYLAAFWAMNEAETLPWSIYMAVNEGQMGAYGIFSALRSPWEYAPIAAAYLGAAVLIRFLLQQLHRLLPKQNRFATVLCVAALAGTAFMMESDVVYMEVTAKDGAMHGLGGVYVLEGLSAVLLLVVVMLLIRILQKLDLQRELRETDRERQRQGAYFQQELAETSNWKALQAREKETMRRVAELLQDGGVAQAQQLLQAEGAPRTENMVQYSSNHVVNAVLCEIDRRCRAKQILFTVKGNLPDKTGVEETDLSALVGNLLTNALEACEKLPPETARSIALRFAAGGGSLLICCENSAPSGKIDFGHSRKAAAGHGYGSRIIDYAAKKYGGTVERQQQDGLVRVTVMLLGVMGESEAVSC